MAKSKWGGKGRPLTDKPYFRNPMSFCTCGHLGDIQLNESNMKPAPGLINSDHYGAVGHGPCKAPKCKCEKFTWKEFTPEYKAFMASQKK